MTYSELGGKEAEITHLKLASCRHLHYSGIRSGYEFLAEAKDTSQGMICPIEVAHPTP
jgi:hypothetical protein